MFVLKNDVCAYDKEKKEWLAIHCGCDGLFRVFSMNPAYYGTPKRIIGYTWEECTGNTFKNLSAAKEFFKNYINLNTGDNFKNDD